MKQSLLRPGRARAAVAAVTILLGGLGVAYAYVATAGGGTGSGRTDSVSDFRVTGSSGFSLSLGQTVDLSGSVRNRNTFPVAIRNITVTVDPTSLPSGCSESDFDIQSVTHDPPYEVPAGGTYRWSGASITLLDDPDRLQNACMGADDVWLDYEANA